MKVGTKLKVIEKKPFTQSYLPVGTICEFVRSFENYTCVRFEGREMLINKHLLAPAERKKKKT